jgi:nitrogen fixation protein FixH
VEPHYYEDAGRWDETQAVAARVAALGWRADLVLVRGVARLTLVDRRGAPLEGATAHVSAVHPAHPGRVLEADLAPVAPGVYEAPLDARWPGAWQVHLDLRRGAERLERTLGWVLAVDGAAGRPDQAAR